MDNSKYGQVNEQKRPCMFISSAAKWEHKETNMSTPSTWVSARRFWSRLRCRVVRHIFTDLIFLPENVKTRCSGTVQNGSIDFLTYMKKSWKWASRPVLCCVHKRELSGLRRPKRASVPTCPVTAQLKEDLCIHITLLR